MRSIVRLPGWIASVALLLIAMLAAPARADTSTCSFRSFLGVGFVDLQVTDTGPFDPQGIVVFGDQIERYSDNLLVDCGSASVTNTEFVLIEDTTPAATSSVDVVLLLETGPLAPGQLNEPGSSDEIEVIVNLGAGDDELHLLANEQPGALRIGQSGDKGGMNLNAFESDGLDADVTLTGVDLVTARMTSPADLGAAGGYATGGPFNGRVHLSGGVSQDHLVGGPRADRLFGLEANDRMAAGAGPDRLFGEEGPDKLRGQAGNDLLNGGKGDDLLAGGKGKDRCSGGGGKDKFRSCEKIVSP